jgi:hypothetical protein
MGSATFSVSPLLSDRSRRGGNGAVAVRLFRVAAPRIALERERVRGRDCPRKRDLGHDVESWCIVHPADGDVVRGHISIRLHQCRNDAATTRNARIGTRIRCTSMSRCPVMVQHEAAARPRAGEPSRQGASASPEESLTRCSTALCRATTVCTIRSPCDGAEKDTSESPCRKWKRIARGQSRGPLWSEELRQVSGT